MSAGGTSHYSEPSGGGGGVTDHDQLINVTPNQHHARLHDHSDPLDGQTLKPSSLRLQGDFVHKMTRVSVDTTLDATHDVVLAGSASAQVTVTLPLISGIEDGRTYYIFRTAGPTFATLIQRSGADTILFGSNSTTFVFIGHAGFNGGAIRVTADAVGGKWIATPVEYDHDSSTLQAVQVSSSAGTSGWPAAVNHAHAMGIINTKGDLLTWTTQSARKGVGLDGTFLKADSTQADGLAWSTPAAAAPVFNEFTKDIGVAHQAGTFDITGLSGLTPAKPVQVWQTNAQVASKGNARDELEMDGIQLTGYVVDANTIRCHWSAPHIVVGIYAFAYLVGG